MIPKLQRDSLLAELAALQKLVDSLPPEDVVVRMNLSDRIEEIRSQLEDHSKDQLEAWAHAGLYFGGSPVVDKKGIDAEFASSAIRLFQDVVSATSAAKRRGPSSPTGPIPDKKASKLHITDVLRGSFGFELAELDSRQTGDPLLGRTPLAEDLDDAAGIVAAAGESDEAFVEAVSDADGRVVGAVAEFFKLLRQRGATFRMVSGALDKQFDRNVVAAAAERAAMTESEEQEVPVRGTFGGAFPASRRFEMITEAKEAIRGRIAKDVSQEDIMAINRRWSGAACVAHMRRARVTRGGAVPLVQYTLLRIEPDAP